MQHKIAAGIVAVLLIAAIGGAVYFYNENQKAQREIQTIRTDPGTVQRAAQEEVKRLVNEVGTLIALPQGEEPTVATITDIEKLKSQAFFKNAKNGDKVLIYTNAKKAILYDPNAKKVIDVAPVNIGTGSAQQATPAKIVIRNGTATAGLASDIETQLKQAIPDANITNKDNSPKKDYAETLVIALTDQAKDAANNIASAISAKVGELPEGENAPANTDILVLIGADKTASTPAPSPTP